MKELLISVMVAVVMTMVIIILRRGMALLNQLLENKKEEAIAKNNQTAAAAYDCAIRVLETVSEITVSRIEATQASKVRAAVQAGKAEWSELTKFSDEAYEEIVKQLSPAVMSALETCVGNTEVLIRNEIEKVLPKVKDEYRKLSDSGVEELAMEGELNTDAEEEQK